MKTIRCITAKIAACSLFAFLITIPTAIPKAAAVPAGAEIYIFAGDDAAGRYAIKSNGDGTFSAVTLTFAKGDNNRGGAVEDFDNDGDLDFVGCDDNVDDCYLFLQGPAGTFTDQGYVLFSLGLNGMEMGMAADDFDQNGNADVVASGNVAGFKILSGDGLGGLAATLAVLSPNTFPFRGKDTADMNGDGYPDVIAAVAGSGEVYIFYNDGTGAVGAGTLAVDTLGSSNDPHTVTTADFNGDGFIDIVAGGSSDGIISLWTGDGAGNFSLVGDVHDFNGRTTTDNYDFDGDGDQDLVSTTQSTKEVNYLENLGGGTFAAPVLIGLMDTFGIGMAAPPSPPIRSKITGTAFNDANGDGLKNDGAGGFGALSAFLTGTDYLGAAVNQTAVTAGTGEYSLEGVRIDDGNGYTFSIAAPAPGPGQIIVPTTAPSRSISIPKENTNLTEEFGFLICTDADGDGFAVEGGACGDLDCNDSDASAHPGASESCDNLDNDCDGTVDEGFVGLGDACSAGVGECAAAGVLVCDGSGNSTVCNAVPGNPSAELCDELDNDCDGESDEEFTALGNTCSAGVGECAAAGVVVCAADGLSTECGSTPGDPSPELCDGLDNDCDGTSDEDFDLDSDGFTSCGGDCDDGNASVNPDAFDFFGDGLDNDCDGGVTCGRKTDYQSGSCHGTFTASNDAQLDSYLANFGWNGTNFKNLRIDYNVNRSVIDMHSPCKIIIKKNKSLTGDSMCIDGRKGVRTGKSVHLTAGRIALLSEEKNVLLNTQTVVNAAEQFLMEAWKKVRVGTKSTISAGLTRLLSVGNTTKSSVSSLSHIVMDVTSLLMQAPRTTKLGTHTAVSATGDVTMFSTDSANGRIKVMPNTSISSATLDLTSAFRAKLGNNTSTTVTGNFNMDAPRCFIGPTAFISAGLISGNCFEDDDDDDEDDDDDDDEDNDDEDGDEDDDDEDGDEDEDDDEDDDDDDGKNGKNGKNKEGKKERRSGKKRK